MFISCRLATGDSPQGTSFATRRPPQGEPSQEVSRLHGESKRSVSHSPRTATEEVKETLNETKLEQCDIAREIVSCSSAIRKHCKVPFPHHTMMSL
ncbi:hypothetical protein PV325_011373 [Microctonus aethiopoides]|nr:hypothetical protein PV325_011373 [Microctonus aethiopoides]